ncbi:nucleoside-triphosphatase [Paenibacillus aurantius]|uniref:Nucleoside-triphosphatase n=1 Tax=Paenibacillus aurantius TaxID=2918900 RepID=A0AA96LH40_9BACL|nr:nucleoside-triphosphatase [Paenibacillus aurantius]WNQ11881.1 nucleoside-triphosphatase [Paenibacillus aurantius]
METCFLLTGKPRAGKSSAIKRIIQQTGPEYFGGFYTEEIRSSTDRTGFTCITLDGKTVCMASVDSTSPVRVGRYGVDLDAFESVALEAVRVSLTTKKITVVDEIGFMQMLSAPFETMIHEVISSSTHAILGTIGVDSHPSMDQIKKLPGVKLYHLGEENRESMIERISKDIRKFL